MKIKIWMLLVIVFVLLQLVNTAQANSDEHIQAVIRNIDNESAETIVKAVKWLNDYSTPERRVRALVLLNEGYKKRKDFAPLFYEWTRYHLINGFDAITGRITHDTAMLASQKIKQAIDLKPGKADYYVLYAHVYTLSEKYKKAADLFKQAERMVSKSPWLKLNKSFWHAKQGQAKPAGALIKSAIEDGIEERRVLMHAWQVLEPYYEANTLMDADPMVFSGKIKRITSKTINNTINSNRGYLVVQITSYDPWCKPCISYNNVIDKMAVQNTDKLSFSRFSRNPWTNFDKELMKKYSLLAVPATLIFYDHNLLIKKMGALKKPALEKLIQEAMKIRDAHEE